MAPMTDTTKRRRGAHTVAGVRAPARNAARVGAERALFVRSQQGDLGARDLLVKRYLPLARSLALRYQHAGEPIDDLLQVASLALVKAIARFDAQRASAFTSYAVPTILGELKRHFRDRGWAVRPPRGLQELTLRIGRATAELTEALHRQPSIAQIAAAVDVSDEHVLDALRAVDARRALSFDAPHNTPDSATPVTLGDTLGVDEPGFAGAEDRATLSRLLSSLSAREREVLRMRFTEDLTQAQIGAVFGVSQMQISRIIRQALAHARAAVDTSQCSASRPVLAPPNRSASLTARKPGG